MCMIAFTITNCSYYSSASSLYTFTDFYDFLDQYQTVIESEKPTLIEEYITWQTNSGGGFPAIINTTTAVFIYYNSSESITSCLLLFPIEVFGERFTMTQLDPNISFFYHSVTFKLGTRLNYVFQIDGQIILDPRNPHKAKEHFFDWEWGKYDSEIALPPFEREYYYVFNPNISHGTLSPLSNFSTDPYVQIYLPPNYNANLTYPVVYFADGFLYTELMDTPTILDNLIAAEKIKPLIGLFFDWPGFDPGNPSGSDWEGVRNDFYIERFHSTYILFLDELIQYIDNHYSTIDSPYARLHVGLSSSGYTSACVVVYHFDTIKLAAIQSGGSLDRLFLKYENSDESLDLKLWICAGTYEKYDGYNFTKSNGYLHEIAKGKGWESEFYSSAEAHTFAFWQHTLDEILEYFFPASWDIQHISSSPSLTSTETTSLTTTATTDSTFTNPISSSFNSSIQVLITITLVIAMKWLFKKKK